MHYADDKNTCATEASKWYVTEAGKWHAAAAGKWHAAKLPLVGNGKLARSLEPRLSVPDFVSQLMEGGAQ